MSADGGPAFPALVQSLLEDGSDPKFYPGMTLRDYFAAHAPEPTADDVSIQRKYDHNRNPHNDGPPRPKLREDIEIRAWLRYRYADAMLADRAKEPK